MHLIRGLILGFFIIMISATYATSLVECDVDFDFSIINDQETNCTSPYKVEVKPNGEAAYTDVTNLCLPDENPLTVYSKTPRQIQCYDPTQTLPPRFTGPHDVHIEWCGSDANFQYGGPLFLIGVIPVNWGADIGWTMPYEDNLYYFRQRTGINLQDDQYFSIYSEPCSIGSYSLGGNWGFSLTPLMDCAQTAGLDAYPIDQYIGIEKNYFCIKKESYFLEELCTGADDWTDATSNNNNLCRHSGSGTIDLDNLKAKTGITDDEFNDMCDTLEDIYDLLDPGNDSTGEAVDYWSTLANGQTVRTKLNDTVYEDFDVEFQDFRSVCEIKIYQDGVDSTLSNSDGRCSIRGWVPQLPSDVAIISAKADRSTLAHQWGHGLGMGCDLYDESLCLEEDTWGCQSGTLCNQIIDCAGGRSVDVGGCSVMGQNFTDVSGLIFEDGATYPTLTNIDTRLQQYINN
ncbi:MAG: hypothetical protein ABH950_01885 [Candidatus Altiarchaeota archaeon]